LQALLAGATLADKFKKRSGKQMYRTSEELSVLAAPSIGGISQARRE
jgi:hypothetical protein